MAVDGCACGHATDKIAFVNVHGGVPFTCPFRGTSPTIRSRSRPDGTQLVFSSATLNQTTSEWSHFQLMAVHLGGGTPVPLAKSGIIGAQFLRDKMAPAAWSSDGKWIAAWRSTASTRPPNRHRHPQRTHRRRRPAGTQGQAGLLYCSTPPASPTQPHSASGTTPSRRSPTWSATRAPAPTANCSGTETPTSTTRARAAAKPAAWSPDSSKLLVLARSGEDTDPLEIPTAGADGSGITRVH